MEKIIIDIAKKVVLDYPIFSYLFFFISQSLQILFPPYPGDMLLIAEGYLAGLANLNIILISVNAITGTFLTSIFLYHVGIKEEYKILHSRIIQYLFDVKKVSKLEKLFNKYGAVVIVISKFIPGIFSITLLSAGVFKVKKKSVYLAVFFITSIHHIMLIILGQTLQENWIVLIRKINLYNRYIIGIVIIGLILYGLVHIIKIKIFKRI